MNGQFDIYQKVDKTLEKLRTVINEDRNKTHGDPCLFAHTFIGMLSTFMAAKQQTGAPLINADAFTILELMKIARTAVAPGGMPPFDTSLDSAGYAVIRAAWLLPPDEAPAAPVTMADLENDVRTAMEKLANARAAQAEAERQAKISAQITEETNASETAARESMASVLASQGKLYKSPVMDAIDAGTLTAPTVVQGPSAPSVAELAAVVDRGGPGAEAPPTTPLVDPVTLNRAPTPLPVVDDGSEHHPDPLWDAPSPVVVEPEPVTDGKAGPKARSKVS